MGSPRDSEDCTKTNSSATSVSLREVQAAIETLAKYGISVDPKEVKAKTGFNIKRIIIATVRDEHGNPKKTYEYENGKLMEEKDLGNY